MKLGRITNLFLFLLLETVLSEVLDEDQTLSQFLDEEQKLRHKKNLLQANKGKYTTKEDVQKAPSEDHPCRLTRTSVEITFPDLSSETFISFLGYKEPNLIHLMRCKGKCMNQEENSEIGCSPIKVRQKKVKMIVKTQLTGRDPREKVKDMILEEHTECGCKCRHISQLNCLGLFNNQTCECECDQKQYGQHKLRCEQIKNSYWDKTSCQCRTNGVAPRGVDLYPGPECGGGGPMTLVDGPLHQSSPTNVEIISLVLLGCFLTVSIFFAASTFHYRKKVRRLLLPKGTKESRRENKEQRTKENGHKKSAQRAKQQQEQQQQLQHQQQQQHLQIQLYSPMVPENQFIDDISFMDDGCDRYDQHGVKIERYDDGCDRYDQHGVKIERDYSDQDFMNHTFR